jgi:hypothetical protein
MYLRFAAAIVALAAGAAGIIVAVTLVRSVPGPTSTAASTPAATAAPASSPPAPTLAGGRIATPNEPGFPSPPPGAVVVAREAGSRVLALAAKRGLVRVSVLGTTGEGESGLKVSLQLGAGHALSADPCGEGCYQAKVPGIPASPVTVRIGASPYRFDLPKLPAAPATAIVARATHTWNALKTLVWHERLASSPTNALYTVYRAFAPHSLAYTIAGKSAAVIIGDTRWDRPSPSAPWQSSAQDPPLRQPQPFWREATDAYVLGTARLGSHEVWRVSFFDPSTPAWFEASVDRASGRTLELDMVAASHFMHDVYGPFDAPVQLEPPT